MTTPHKRLIFVEEETDKTVLVMAIIRDQMAQIS
jgi:hypothetical protein